MRDLTNCRAARRVCGRSRRVPLPPRKIEREIVQLFWSIIAVRVGERERERIARARQRDICIRRDICSVADMCVCATSITVLRGYGGCIFELPAEEGTASKTRHDITSARSRHRPALYRYTDAKVRERFFHSFFSLFRSYTGPVGYFWYRGEWAIYRYFPCES